MTTEKAYREYVSRQRGWSRSEGEWRRNEAAYWGREWVSFEEHDCCASIRKDYKLAHTRTATHVAHLYGLDPAKFRQYVSKRRMQETTSVRRAAKDRSDA